MEVNIADTSYVGLHLFWRMSKQIPPSAYTFGWNILDTKRTVGGLFGYSSVNSIVNLNVPSSNGVSCGLKNSRNYYLKLKRLNFQYRCIPKYHSIPYHNIIIGRCSTNTSRWIFLKSSKMKKKKKMAINLFVGLLKHYVHLASAFEFSRSLRQTMTSVVFLLFSNVHQNMLFHMAKHTQICLFDKNVEIFHKNE